MLAKIARAQTRSVTSYQCCPIGNPYVSLCSCCTPQNGICGGTTQKKFLLALFAVIFEPPTLKIVVPPLVVYCIYMYW